MAAREDAVADFDRPEPDRRERVIEGHGPLPRRSLRALDGEPLYGQDRFDLLVWRLEQNGLRKREARL